MTIGTGIFGAALFLGLIALYISTQGRWPWKRILLWPIAILATLGIGLCAAWAIYIYLENRPVAQHELAGIPLGAARGDVKFVKGLPDKELELETWIYKTGEGFYAVRFKNERVRFVMYEGSKADAPNIAGLSMYSSLTDISEKLGQPSYISRHKDELKRLISFSAYNIAFALEKGEITSLGIFDPAEGPIKYSTETK